MLAAGGLPALASTRATAPSITLAATSKLEVAGDVVVLYLASKQAYTVARISGKVSGALSGSVVKLYAQPFPYQQPAKSVASATAGSQYSFTVKPAIATRYQAELFAMTRSGGVSWSALRTPKPETGSGCRVSTAAGSTA